MGRSLIRAQGILPDCLRDGPDQAVDSAIPEYRIRDRDDYPDIVNMDEQIKRLLAQSTAGGLTNTEADKRR